MNYLIKIQDREYKKIILQNENTNLELSIEDFKNFNKIKFFHDDIINYDKTTKIINRVFATKMNNIKIIGILEINKKMIYGLNSRKNPYFLFTPLLKCYPKFYVCINDKKLKNTNGKFYITIKFNIWTKKIPFGVLNKFIGKVGEKENEIEKLLNYYEIDTKKYKLHKKFKVSQKNNIHDYIDNNELKDYLDMRNQHTISIDPKGSKDIDDALSIEYLPNNEYKVGIHISDVSFWYNKFDLKYFLRNNRFSTVYLKDKKFNLYPNILSDFLMSLIKGKDRLSLSLFIIFNEDSEIKEYYFKNTILNVNRNFCYRKVDNILKDKNLYENNKDLFELFNISKKLKINKNIEDFDSHNMIENFMILSNQITAEYLIENDKKPILRYHKSPNYKIPLEKIENNELRNFMKIFQLKAAEYKIYEKTDEFNYYHYGLDLKYYTHYTSPIRRFTDLIIHFKIKEVLYGEETKIEYNIKELNKVNKNLRKMDREMRQLEILDNIGSDRIFESHLIDYKDNILFFYIPEIKYFFRKKIYDNDDMLINIDFIYNNEEICIKNIKNQKSIILEKYFSYKISINKISNMNEYNYSLIDKNFLEILN
jgi:exoribonuclease R